MNEAGFGFTAPAVTFTGGNPTPGFDGHGRASGGVDNVTLVDGGTGYTIQPIVEFSLPDLPGGTQATGTATMDANGVVDGVDRGDPGLRLHVGPDGHDHRRAAGPVGQPVADPAVVDRHDRHRPDRRHLRRPGLRLRAHRDDHRHRRHRSTRARARPPTVAVKGAVTAITVTAPGAGYLTPGLKKFVDTLAGLGPTAANDLGKYIPVAVPDTTTYPGADYYEIAVVQYRQKFHTDLPATLLRGYVQLSTSVVPGNQVPLSNANLDPARRRTPALMPDGAQASASTTPLPRPDDHRQPRTGRSGSCSATCCRPASPGTCSCRSTRRSWAPAWGRTRSCSTPTASRST